MIRVFLFGLLMLVASAVAAQTTSWGVFDEMAQREWTTEKEPRARVTKFRWIEPGRVLEARHGFASRLQFGDSKFADTVQRFVLNEKTRAIDVTYTYEDGRPPLKAVIRIQADGTAVETFTDAQGVNFRNTYRTPSLSINNIVREKRQGEAWTTLGTTRKAGLTALEIAENKRRAEEAAQLALAEQRAREAERQAQIAQQEAEAAAQQNYEEEEVAQSGPNMLDVLRGLASDLESQNQQQRERFNRQVQQDIQAEARQKAEAARAEANRIAAENAQRRQAADARRTAIASQSAQPDPASRVSAQPSGTQADAERARRAEEQRRVAEDIARRDAQERQRVAEADRQRREAEVARQRQVEEAAEQRRQEEARRPVPFREGVVLCSRSGNEWRCDGPLQVTYGNIDASTAAIDSACGANSSRSLGAAGGYRAYGCGFGINPSSSYPGNRDVAAALGVVVGGRQTYYCPKDTDAYCRGR